MKKTIIVGWDRYCQDKRTGYYSRTEKLHRAEWIFHNGKIPDKHVIHHRNFNPLDNRISNLQCMSAFEHRSLHSKGKVRTGEARRSISISISESSKRIEVRGRRYCLDKVTGYYESKILLHREKYEKYYGVKIPSGAVVHHIDEDKVNNAIENLQCMTKAKHTSLHSKGKKLTEEHKIKIGEASKGRIFSEEHKIKIGEASKGRRYTEETKQKMSESAKKKPKRECACTVCGKTYMAANHAISKYCSQSCNIRAWQKRNKLKLNRRN